MVRDRPGAYRDPARPGLSAPTPTLSSVDVASIELLRDKHPAWRLLRAQHAPLVVGFLGSHFVDATRGATSSVELAAALEEQLAVLNASDDPAARDDPPYPRSAADYLEAWAAPESGWLRRFYPTGSDDVHYDATPALEKAYSWVVGLRTRSFVGTESRLHTVVDLLRQMVRGSEADPDARIAELHRQRDEVDRQIAEAEAGGAPLLSDGGLRDRYQQLSATARELLSDFREVEDNFRGLDRAAREKIASWTGSKGELLAELVAGRADISTSDQGTSFQAFYDFLLSERRQDELSDLLARVQALSAIEVDHRMRRVHHDWSEAAERTQQTVRQISEQLRRFLDDQVWLENRRVLDLVREVESAAVAVRTAPPPGSEVGLDLELPGISLALPFERPLYDSRPPAAVDSILGPVDTEDLDVSALFTQTFVDQARLADNVREVLPAGRSALLADILDARPVQQGVAEIIGYLSLVEDDLVVDLDESSESLLEYADLGGVPRRVRLPLVTVSRR